MAAFASIDFNSDSDVDDEDFVPETGKLDSDEDETGVDAKKKKSKSQSNKSRKAGGIFLEEESGDRRDDVEDEASRKREFEAEKEEKADLEEEKRQENLWADFTKNAPSAVQSKTSKPPNKKHVSSSLGNFGARMKPKTSGSVRPPAAKKPTKDLMASIFGTPAQVVADRKSGETSVQQRPRSIVDSIFESSSSKPEQSNDPDTTNNEESGDTATEAQEEESSSESGGKIKITKVFDFAGENVEVTKEVDKYSKEARTYLKEQQKELSEGCGQAVKRQGGLNSIMGVIAGKKLKMGCLEKSKIDWEEFVHEEGIKEELKSHNKGKGGFVEKQMFLERADHKRFEMERDAREKTRKPINK